MIFDGEGERRRPGRPATPGITLPVPAWVTPPRVTRGQLLIRDFAEAANQGTAPPSVGEILVHTVPEGELIRLSGPAPEDQVLNLRPQGSQEGTGTTTAGGALTITLTTLRAIESPDDPGPRSVQVFLQTGGGSWVRVADAQVAIAWATQVITVSGLLATTLYSWLVFAFIDDPDGLLAANAIGAGAAAGAEVRPVTTFNLRGLQRRDQISDRTAPRFNTRGVLLAPFDQFAITLLSTQRYAPRRTLTPPAGGLLAGTLTQLEIRKATTPWLEFVRYYQEARPGVGWTPDRVRQVVRAQQTGRLATEGEALRWLAGMGLAVTQSLQAIPPLPPELEV